VALITTDITTIIALLKANEVVAIPTETVYGLAGDIYSNKAIESIFTIKQRPLTNPLIVHIGAVQQLQSIASDIPLAAQLLINAFWPGPLTLVLPKHKSIPLIVTAHQQTVAVRMPQHPICLQLLQALNTPLAAPSANPYNYISPTTAQHVQQILGNSIPAILDGGPCNVGIESTIVGFENGKPTIYRHGSISKEQIQNIIGEVGEYKTETNSTLAPGMMLKHYSPHTAMLISTNALQESKLHTDKKVAILLPICDATHNASNIYILSKHNINEAAYKLYDTLHTLDNNNYDLIITELCPNSGLGQAINEKLIKAAFKSIE
jgi:L-threonylcarbamoyladenylate synthase